MPSTKEKTIYLWLLTQKYLDLAVSDVIADGEVGEVGQFIDE